MAELLKEAIADAKAVREVALQNAKMALEEAFDSKIKNMLSAKLAEEIEEDVELEEEYMEEDEPTSEGYYEEDDTTVDEEFELEEDLDEEINLDELMAELEEMSYDEDETMEEEYNEDESVEEGKDKEDTNESIDIDALIAEIEAELEEGKDQEDEKATNEELEEAKRRAKKAKEEKEEKEEELKEALATVEALRESISEMNLLNSKLLYCNKLFKANSLNESQKVKVIDALDRATTTGEAKLVFETLQESFIFTGMEKKAIKEGLARASKPAGTSPKNVITESADETVSRFQKLANIKL